MAQRKDGLKQASQKTSDTLKGSKRGTNNYKLDFDPRGSNVVQIIDKTRGPVRRGAPIGEFVVRVDRPHRGAMYPHVNINHRLAGIPNDPHIRIPTRGLSVASHTGRVLQKANKVLVPLSVAMDGLRIGSNIYDDYNKGTTINSVESIASVAGGWTGAYGGAVGGASAGTLVFPGIGTIIGGLAGGISGALAGSYAAEGITSTIGDSLDYDIVMVKCKGCGRDFKCRAYTEQSRKYCENCASNRR